MLFTFVYAGRCVASGGSESQLRPENYHHDPGANSILDFAVLADAC
jgi:hypothetical protein